MQLCKKIQQFSLHHATALYQIKTVTVSIICKQEKLHSNLETMVSIKV